MKGYSTDSGFMGYVGGRYILFASESDYYDYMEDQGEIMGFDKNKMRAVLIDSDGDRIAGFRERQTGVFHAMMRIDSSLDLDLFMETYNLSVVNIE